MKRLVPLLVAAAVFAGGLVLQAGGASDACAQGSAVVAKNDCRATAAVSPQQCAATTEGFRTVSVRPRGRGLRFGFTRRVNRPVRIDVFQVSTGRKVLRERLVARFANRRTGLTWSGRGNRGTRPVRDGLLFARFTLRDERGRADDRRITLQRSRGRFRLRPDFYRRASCGSLSAFKLERPAFGRRSLGISFRLARPGRVTVEVRRGGRLVRRFATTTRSARRTHRLRLSGAKLPRGLYEVRLVSTSDTGSVRAVLYAQRI